MGSPCKQTRKAVSHWRFETLNESAEKVETFIIKQLTQLKSKACPRLGSQQAFKAAQAALWGTLLLLVCGVTFTFFLFFSCFPNHLWQCLYPIHFSAEKPLTSEHKAKAVAFLVEGHLNGLGNNASTAFWH